MRALADGKRIGDEAPHAWRVIGNLVELALAHGADFVAIATALVAPSGDRGKPDPLLALPPPAREDVAVSRDWVAEQFRITPQGVSHLLKQAI
ncbi:MAG: hypothetical protein OXR82_14680 [Gammaproteobacteria bacterium]|nr:hypothetical protein [Gammaproteobacteria bacterium]